MGFLMAGAKVGFSEVRECVKELLKVIFAFQSVTLATRLAISVTQMMADASVLRTLRGQRAKNARWASGAIRCKAAK